MKNTLKKLLALTLACLMLTILTLPAAADVIYEPEDNFYKTHSDECVYNNYRRYLTNGEDGYVYLYQSPVSDLTVKAYPNGETVNISYLYTSPEGEVWGILGDDSGWFDMSELSLIYDSQSFLEDNKDKCVPYDDSFASITASNEAPVLRWTYPGGESNATLTSGSITDFVQLTYIDDNGQVWGYINYMYGMRNFWVCLSDPHSETVGDYALSDHEVELKHEPVAQEDIPVNKSNITTGIVAGVLIVLVVIGTAVIIRVFFGKKSKS